MSWLVKMGLGLVMFWQSLFGAPSSPTHPVVNNTDATTVLAAKEPQSQSQVTYTTPVNTRSSTNDTSSSSNDLLWNEHDHPTPPGLTGDSDGTRNGHCYEDINNQINYIDASGKPMVMPEADLESFSDAPYAFYCFGQDKNHVYDGAQILSWADPNTFDFLDEFISTTSGGRIDFFSGRNNGIEKGVVDAFDVHTTIPLDHFSVVPNGDAGTFKIVLGTQEINAPFADDKNNVYCNGSIITGADPRTVGVKSLSDTNGDWMYDLLLVKVAGITHTYDSSCVATTTPQ